jgi:cephalosporin hydroxylase
MFSEVLTKYSNMYTHLGTDKIYTHSYGDVYDSLFLEFKDKTPTVLEIGIDGGYALKAYSEYFENSKIYGIDIRDNISADIKNNTNIQLCFGDAKDSKIINTFPYAYDIIIEDASHTLDDQIQHFKDYSKYVRKGGIYIIEDVHQDNYERVLKETREYAKNNNFTVKEYDLRNIKNRFDDILIVFRKNN